MVIRLSERWPEVSPDRLLSECVPPPRFADVRFATYRPDPAEPSQTEALTLLTERAAVLAQPRQEPTLWSRLRGRTPAPGKPGIYLDGGFGVGKTHLLASLWHEAAGPKMYCTFVELTNLVGALGLRTAVEALSPYRVLCIDEFELDDPGDTMLITRLLGQLVGAGVQLAATSNTLPDKLGEGRFQAVDFLREIQALAANFDVRRIDGPDYRHRGLPTAPDPWPDERVEATAAERPDTSCDHFVDLHRHLAELHPSKYGALLDGVQAVGITDIRPLTDENVALRLVVLADRMYDRDLPLLASGVPLDQLFSAAMLKGGYRKKYLRALSRLIALARKS
ncbi:cell division protein ZapE [Kribbella sandramycini]|uniref:Cell division protein ZapE n=1 Tax=Kribbella sandramycini TaxID=60450 RepID=A0A7Y4KYK1_9ACTN|nr:cell division protein ZapE [Kribbella sandramycini]MBB6569109.1 cell division protein ZapE [Kribbella sandramycini]NOL41048.1 cell division protein ZapE [Kribbella sandramycini]